MTVSEIDRVLSALNEEARADSDAVGEEATVERAQLSSRTQAQPHDCRPRRFRQYPGSAHR